MTFEANIIYLFRPQQMLIFAAVRLMASRASLHKCGLMQMRFLELFRLIRVAGQTGAHRIRLQKSRSLSRMRIMAGDAFSLRSGMRHLGLVDLLHLLAVTSGAQGARVGVGQDNFAILRRRVAHVAGLLGKRRMRELLQQLRLRRLVRIMALRTGGRCKRLALVSFHQRGVFDVVAFDAKLGNGTFQVIVEFLLTFFADFVGDVASVASHVQRGMPATFFRDIRPLRVASEAEIVFLLARRRLQQLKFIIRGMRIMALDAVPNRRRMDRSFEGRRVLIGMAGDAQGLRSRGDQLDAGDVLVDPDLMTSSAAHRDRGVNGLALRLLFMAPDARGAVRLRVKRHRMNRSARPPDCQGD